MTAQTNIWEQKNRGLKLDRLVEALDRYLVKLEVADPVTDGVGIAEGLRKWTKQQWADFAVSIGVRPPSAITIGLICDRYERRQLLLDATKDETSGVFGGAA